MGKGDTSCFTMPGVSSTAAAVKQVAAATVKQLPLSVQFRRVCC